MFGCFLHMAPCNSALACCLCICMPASHSLWDSKCTVKCSSYIFSLSGHTVICLIGEFIIMVYCSDIVTKHSWVWSHVLRIYNIPFLKLIASHCERLFRIKLCKSWNENIWIKTITILKNTNLCLFLISGQEV
jgi:hypothetical protein